MATEPAPTFPLFRDISIGDRPIFDNFFQKHRPNSSEYTFANFICWKSCEDPKITIINDNLCIMSNGPKGGHYFYEPLGVNKIRETVEICMEYLKKKGQKPKLSRLTEDFIGQFRNDTRYLIEEDTDNFDYVYYSKELIELKGKNYDGKRNRIKRIINNYKLVTRPLNAECIPACKELLKKWRSAGKDLCIEGPIEAFLEYFDRLGVTGSCVLINDRVEAFTIGEKLNDETAVIYVEVSNPGYAGLSQFINRKFSEEWASFKYINREQDMGDAGLRRAKRSYHPCMLIRKYNMSLKERS